MELSAKGRILLVDEPDARRNSRVALLQAAAYEVVARHDEVGNDEDFFDLVIVRLHDRSEQKLAYRDRLARTFPSLRTLLLVDHGVMVTLSPSIPHIEAGDPEGLLTKMKHMLGDDGQSLTSDVPQQVLEGG